MGKVGVFLQFLLLSAFTRENEVNPCSEIETLAVPWEMSEAARPDVQLGSGLQCVSPFHFLPSGCQRAGLAVLLEDPACV